MELPQISKIYYIANPNSGEPCYFFSVKREDNKLSFSYYMLFYNEGKTKLRKLNKTLEFLQSSKVNLLTVQKDSDEYNSFMSMLNKSLFGDPVDHNKLIKKK